MKCSLLSFCLLLCLSINQKLTPSHNDDSEEFVGEPMPIVEELEHSVIKNKPLKYQVREVKPWYKEHILEILAITLIILCVTQFFRGKNYNLNIINIWSAINIPYYKSQFTSIKSIEQDSYNLFRLYSTGRSNCIYCLTMIELKRRHNLLLMITFNLIYSELDRVSYTIALTDYFPCTLTIVRRTGIRFALESGKEGVRYELLSKYSLMQRDVKGLTNTFAVITEYDEITEHLLTSQVIFE
jgi:hypothetical protein